MSILNPALVKGLFVYLGAGLPAVFVSKGRFRRPFRSKSSLEHTKNAYFGLAGLFDCQGEFP